MKPSRKTILYTAYVIGITAFFLWYLFPSESLKAYLAYRLNQINPDVRVTIDRIRPTLPPGIQLRDVGLAHRNLNLIDLDDFKVMPGLRSLFSRTTVVNFKSRLCEGTLSGRLELTDLQRQDGLKIRGRLEGVQVQQIPALQQLSEHKISGGLSGTFAYDGSTPAAPLAGNLAMADCRVELAMPAFSQKLFEFKTIAADLAVNTNSLLIKQLSARGNQLDLDLAGSIDLLASGAENAVKLTGNVTPHHVFLAQIEKEIPVDFLRGRQAGKAAIGFKIDGTLDEPEFSLN